MQLESGFSVINTTEGRELSMDVSPRELASTVNNSDFFEAWLPGTAGRARFPAIIIPPKNHILPIPRKPNSVHSVYSAIGSRMNGIAFRSFRKRNMFQKNAITVYSEHSYSGIVPKERALRKRNKAAFSLLTSAHCWAAHYLHQNRENSNA